MSNAFFTKAFITLSAVFALQSTPAIASEDNEWTIYNNASHLHFVSVKNNQIGEVSTFETLKGHLSGNGQFALEILLDSVNTGIEIRDQRMKEHLFDSKKNIAFIVNGSFDLSEIEDQETGSSSQHTLEATIQLGNETVDIQAPVTIQTLADHQLRVTSVSPVVISISNLKLDKGVDKLKSLAGLRSIDRVVPVTFDLYLQPKGE
ncbi:YceI family protein [Kangiella koreensis]|uniref:YceI family protein n=1 Tax=Kangiella koreensis (strain DSM 16069 / JCM 12317 / KCTC 12182 / SW-125) TaxID=523791 RepID=C7R7I5_KANKD|nr:YceI family protein [Kangiella koreensis]ACV25734.1 YceI family protein [Kangiella koreensis DSM 16069]